MPYIAVVDVETTGLNPYRHDRIIEVAAVVIQPNGKLHREFVSLINPERDIGPTSIHGLTTSDILKAPRFADVACSLLEVLSGCVAVAGHNVRFDFSFLIAEFERLGCSLPNSPTLCTLQLAGGGNLASCCTDYQITFDGEAHAALHDARATAKLLVAMLRDAPREMTKISKLPPIAWPRLPKSSAPPLTRDESRRQQVNPPTYLQRLITRVQRNLAVETDNSSVLAYVGLLDRAIEDRRVDDKEAETLIEFATRWGLDASQIRETHQNYLYRLAATAVADGVVTETERRDLSQVAHLLGVEYGQLNEIMDMATRKLAEVPIQQRTISKPLFHGQLTGKRVCFTGECQSKIEGSTITREKAEELAAHKGLIIVESVTKKLDLLVVADPLTQSGKAKKARQYGIRIMHEPVFWKTIGVDVE